MAGHNRPGADAGAWYALGEFGCGLEADLLPVVSDLSATISSSSKMKGLGKTPSFFNHEGEVVGIARWTERTATEADIERWSTEPRYGICVQTRRARALDIDVPHSQAADIARSFVAAIGVELPVRIRENSEKQLLMFGLEGEYPKRSFKTEHGLVEFLGNGQQFIASGTHPSGARYVWLGGVPIELIMLTPEQFEKGWQKIVELYAIEAPNEGGIRRKGEDFAASDTTAAYLLEKGLVLDEGRNGELYVTCPWKGGHSSDSGVTEAAWFPAGTGGYDRGHYKCLHTSCAGRTDTDFELAVGINPADDFDELPIEQPEPEVLGAPKRPRPPTLDPKNARRLAQAALDGPFTRDGTRTLLRTGGLWYEHRGSAYAERTDEDIRNDVWKFLGTAYKLDKNGNRIEFNPTPPNVTATLDALRSAADFEDISPPSWLPGCDPGLDPLDLVPLRDGLLHIPTRKLRPHTPGFFSVNALPFAWGDGNGTPTNWLRFLDTVWPGDDEAIGTLQEWLGYMLTPDTSQQKMLLLNGPRRSGKGTIGRILAALVGRHNLASPTLASLTQNFGLQPLIGKLVAIVPDARAGGQLNMQAAIERLLMISGEDNITVDRKNQTAWTGVLAARFTIMSNEIPKFSDPSGALSGRFVNLTMSNSFYGLEDRGLGGRLMGELPAIFRWALEGRERLAERGHFIQPKSGEADAKQLYHLGNPIAGFVEDCCEIVAEGEALTDLLYEAWRGWCGENGHHPGAKATFMRSLHTAFPQLGTSRVMLDGTREPIVTGIAINERTRKKLQFGSL